MSEKISNSDFNRKYKTDHSGTIAEAFFIANLLFIGIFYLLLWGLYFMSYKHASQISKNHIKQTLLAASFTTSIVILLNIIIVMTTGYASVEALLSAEVYLMVVVPLFMVLGIVGFTRAVNEKDFKFPIIGGLLGVGQKA
jgi:uncharacterized membrane protein